MASIGESADTTVAAVQNSVMTGRDESGIKLCVCLSCIHDHAALVNAKLMPR